MKVTNAKIIREKYVSQLFEVFREEEDVNRISSGSIAFPVVADDGEEGWVEIVVKIPKWSDDDDGYSKAREYEIACADKAEREKEKAEAKATKIAEKEKKKKEKDETGA